MNPRSKSKRFEAAERIAEMLLQKGAEEVHLFGSLTEQEASDQINLLVVISDLSVIQYYDSIDQEMIFNLSSIRNNHLEVLGKILSISNEEWTEARQSASLPEDVEILVLPFGWQYSLGELSKLLLQKESRFLQTVSEQAMRFNKFSKRFE